ncbi:MAG: AI-2E family transporter [Kiritimatiellia bacterium]
MNESRRAYRINMVIGLLATLVIIALCFVLRQAQQVILPLIIAWLLSYVLGPVVTFMTRRRIPAGLAVALVLLLLLGVGYLGGMFVITRIQSFWAAFPDYQNRVMVLLRETTAHWSMDFDPLVGIDWGGKLAGFMAGAGRWAISFSMQLTMVIIYLVFLLLGKPFFNAKLRAAFKERQATRISSVLGAISVQIGVYLSLQLLISAATGIFVWLGLTWMKVDFAVTWGVLAFLLNFIPTVGSIIASVPPLLIAFVQFESFWPLLGVGLMLLAIQITIGNFISPKLLGERLNLSPVVVLISLVFWGWLLGIVGALLSVPIASSIKIVCENFAPLRPISIMMGSGRVYKRQESA